MQNYRENDPLFVALIIDIPSLGTSMYKSAILQENGDCDTRSHEMY
jgi:hypothetical protein